VQSCAYLKRGGSAGELLELLVPPANRLEKLKGSRGGQHSIRINDQWRICFLWQDDGPYEVDIADYHQGEESMVKNDRRPVHPGKILLEEFMKPLDPPINANMLAKALDVPANRITAIIKGHRGFTGDTPVID
jgi:hypothetical protein